MPLLAGAAYFALVFAAGFVLGTVRVFALEPALGAFWSVLAEMPIILAACWLASAFVIRRLDVPLALPVRLVMGGSAFLLLIAAELALSVFAFARTPIEFAASLAAPAGLLGLAGQLLFAAFPAIQALGGAQR